MERATEKNSQLWAVRTREREPGPPACPNYGKESAGNGETVG